MEWVPPGPRGGWRHADHMSFLRRFSLVGLVVTLAVGATMAYAVARQLTDNEVNESATFTARHLSAMMRKSLVEADFDTPWSAERMDAMDALLVRELPGTGVVRVKLWRPDGTVLYSDERRLVGQRFEVGDDLAGALAGEVSGELSHLDRAENQWDSQGFAQLLEVYVPVRAPDGTVMGAFEVYRDSGRLAAAVSVMKMRIWVGAGIAFLVVYVALFGIARQASRTLVESEREARRRLEETLLLDRVITTASAAADPGAAMRIACRELSRALSAPRCAALSPRHGGGVVLAEWTEPGSGTPARLVDEDHTEPALGPPAEGQVPAWAEVLRTEAPVVWNGRDGDGREGELRERFRRNRTSSALFLPLPAQGRGGGVIWAETDAPRTWADTDLALAQKVAVAANMAIDNAMLLDDLRAANDELGAAYESTIEGWARALDLRDRETEGHSRRVTELTLELLRTAGCPEDLLVHARRGALLHDIGKLAVPDTILLKPGPLTDEEWAIMRLHPDYARRMLDPIPHLRPALDIPYSHHERWDGSGYPLGVSGEDIPLAARMFAVVDVWDALLSDRPYRPAWPESRVLEYLDSLRGTHLDPRAVDLFMSLRRERGSSSRNVSGDSARSPAGSSGR